MVLRFPYCFNKLVNDMGRRGMVRVTHAKVNNILTCSSRLQLHLIERGKQIGRESCDPWKFHTCPVKLYYSGYLSTKSRGSRPCIKGIVDFWGVVKRVGTQNTGSGLLDTEVAH